MEIILSKMNKQTTNQIKMKIALLLLIFGIVFLFADTKSYANEDYASSDIIQTDSSEIESVETPQIDEEETEVTSESVDF